MYKFNKFMTLMVVVMSLTACGGGDEAPANNGPVTDTTAPTISINGPSSAPTYSTANSSIDLTGIASDDLGIIDITWTNNRGGTGSINIEEAWGYQNINLSPGENIIRVTVTDGAENTATETIIISYNIIDNNNPVIAITSPNNANSFNTDINRLSVAGTATDNISVRDVRWNLGTQSGTAIGTDPWIVNDLPLTVGNNILTVTAYDDANNSATDTLDIIYQIVANSESCMGCHNGSAKNDYAGTGLTNPHPFSGAQNIRCTVCHGGDGTNTDKNIAHVPPPPEIGDDTNLINNPTAYFNRLTLTGLDTYADYTVGAKTYSALDYLQFINPGDLRVVSGGKSCGRCHGNRHVEWVMKSPLATETGILGGSLAAAGIENAIPAHRGKYLNTASDFGFRSIINPNFVSNLLNTGTKMGAIGELYEFPVISQFGIEGGNNLYNNLNYDANNLTNDLYTINDNNGDQTNAIRVNSNLSRLYQEQIAFTCGNCHLGSAGANNRFGDYRSSGCTACHMAYSPDGRSRSTDTNVNKLEPANPDAIVAPERPHIATHLLKNVAKTLPNGQIVTGIQDQACAGCHQGSNRTVLQFWGIRLDQNQDLVNQTQYPTNPVNFKNTADDTRLYDPAVNNNTFNGRNANQYIAYEDYDGDGRDDTPADVHHEAGMGCIDCHGSRDLHGGAPGDDSGNEIYSRQEQVVAISCESCHGTIDAYANTVSCLNYNDKLAECATDTKGNPLRHVTREDATGNFILLSRLDGKAHYVSQTRDTIIRSNKTNPFNRQLVYSPKASYAMGRADGNPSTGIGPIQANTNNFANGFSHSDNMDCVSCHAAWTNSCIGCHLAGEYDGNVNNFRFSNITGERIAYNEQAADFIYQTPIPFQLGISTDNKISQLTPATKAFYRYTDINGQESQVLAFGDRNGNGNNPGLDGRNQFPALNHNTMMAHSIRGKVQNNNEGPRYCVACHLNTDSLANFGTEYDVFRQAMATNDFNNLNFTLLQQHIGQNTGNQLNSPLWVHMVAGLGSGLFLFDQNGCPVNPLDANANRENCNNAAPADNFDPNNVIYNLDRVVEATGVSNASNNHPIKVNGNNKRGGSLNPGLSGPLGAQLIRKLTDPVNGIVLDSWIDADGQAQGNAADFIQ